MFLCKLYCILASLHIEKIDGVPNSIAPKRRITQFSGTAYCMIRFGFFVLFYVSIGI